MFNPTGALSAEAGGARPKRPRTMIKDGSDIVACFCNNFDSLVGQATLRHANF
jgi:hypothetical protein